MRQDDIDDLRVELLVDEASRDTPANRTRRELLAQLTLVNKALADLDDVDDLRTRACELAERVRQELPELVQAAVRFDRARGATWEDIGAGLNVSRQAAWERFGP